jgi:NAD(P) transhydrogenase subunit beta
MTGFLVVAYLAAGVLFIRSLGGLSKQETASEGNTFGVLGMAVAVAVTSVAWVTSSDLSSRMNGLGLLLGAAVIGGVIGGGLARRVEMTGMPELVAILHSFVGLAAVLVGFSSYLHPATVETDPVRHGVHLAEIWVGIAVGAITLTGSIVAWARRRFSGSVFPLVSSMAPKGCCTWAS